jgi:hypothetical protein
MVDAWQDDCRPSILPESDPHLEQWEETKLDVEEWMIEAKAIAVAGCRRVLEDRLDFCSSERSAEYSDHGKN